MRRHNQRYLTHNKASANVDGITDEKSENLSQLWNKVGVLKSAAEIRRKARRLRARCNFENKIVSTPGGDRAHGRESYTLGQGSLA